MIITDRYDHVLDDKGRLAIPSQVRSAMDPELDGAGFYLVPEGRYLQLIPEKLFKRLAEQVPAGLSVSPEAAKVRRLFFGSASYLEPDKQGRVVIPERFLTDAKNRDPFTQAILGRQVTIVGACDRLELWNRTDLEGHMRELHLDRGSLQSATEQMFTAPARSAGISF